MVSIPAHAKIFSYDVQIPAFGLHSTSRVVGTGCYFPDITATNVRS
jgi:hypothetical protein